MSDTNPIPPDEWKIYDPLVGNTMLELGNKKNSNGIYKTYFESLGFKHVSVDWNGEDGALARDLRKPLSLGQFDMVTNIGTTEHVSEQTPVWENIHNACKIDGIIVSVTPYEGNWWWHGNYYPKMKFFEQFCANGYEIEDIHLDREYPNKNLYVRLKKTGHNDFIMPESETIYFNRIRPR